MSRRQTRPCLAGALGVAIAVVIATVAVPSRAQPGDVEGRTERAEPPHDTGLAATARFGMASSRTSNDGSILAPSIGLGLEHFFLRYLGVSLHYDASLASRGTSVLTVRRLTQQVLLTADGRLHIHRAVSLHAGVGGGAALLVATTSVFDETHSVTSLEPGLAWAGSVDVDIPRSALRTAFGVTGLLHQSSHDLLYYAGLSLSF